MASFTIAVHSSLFCFLLLLACSSPHAQARESQFFSKAARDETAKPASLAKEELPPLKKEEPVQYTSDNGNGYGLYGRGPEKLPPASTATYTPSTYNYNSADENLNTEEAPSEFPNNEFTGVSYENKEFNTAGYTDKKHYANNKAAYNPGSVPESELNAGSYSKYNKEPNTRYPSYYTNQREQYGMSDTRFLENGRYFYDPNLEESYRSGSYDPSRGNPRAYGSFEGRYGYGNSNKGNAYEENTSMQGYQNNQENTQVNPEEYAP